MVWGVVWGVDVLVERPLLSFFLAGRPARRTGLPPLVEGVAQVVEGVVQVVEGETVVVGTGAIGGAMSTATKWGQQVQ